MRVLLVGGGGREHALAWKLAQSAELDRLIAAPGNPGIAAHATCVPIRDTDVEELVALARRERVDLVVVGPELPLALGLADRLRESGFAVFGASRAAARLNCRFGDPECQVILPRLDQDLLPLLLAVARGERLGSGLAWRAESSVCVVLASWGYPGRYETGLPIAGVAEAARLPGATIFQAGTAMREGALVTAGGRVLGVQALGADIADAIARAYTAAGRISFEGAHCRKDIGRRAIGRR